MYLQKIGLGSRELALDIGKKRAPFLHPQSRVTIQHCDSFKIFQMKSDFCCGSEGAVPARQPDCSASRRDRPRARQQAVNRPAAAHGQRGMQG